MRKEINMTYSEYTDLKSTIDFHMDAYYNLDEPVISDYEYDQLMQKLKQAEKEHPEWVTPDSPSQKIGGVVKRTAGVKVTHDVPMLSIEDVFSKEDVISWIDKVHTLYPDCEFSVEAKIDGLSMSLRYEKKEDGKLHLTLAETRGDGLVGEDVTANALVIPDVRQVLDLPYDSLELRGEVYMTHENFEKYNAVQSDLGKKLAANPRNLAAGTLRQLDTSVTKDRGLKMFVFNVQNGPKEVMQSHVDGMDLLSSKGVPVVYHRLCKTSDDVLNAIDAIGEMRSSLPYDIDGAVVKLNSIELRNDFPAGSKYSSGHIAYKYPPEEKIVEIDDILVDVGRTGKLTFTSVFHDRDTGLPARLCGTSVSRATLHNIDYIKDLKIGVGGWYTLFKSGEIIPRLKKCVKEPPLVFDAPEYCPVCGSKLVRDEDFADIRCVNPSCKVQLSRTISYFASINAMNIIGLGEIIVDKLLTHGYLNSYADIYRLHLKRDELVESGIIGKEKNTDKILGNIEKSKSNDAYKLLTGLGIRNVGERTSKILMRHYSSIQELMTASEEELTAIDDVGPVTAKCICDFFALDSNREIMSVFESEGVNMASSQFSSSDGKLSGLTFVITGTLPTLERKDAENLIEQNGGKATSSVSKKTSFVIAGEAAGSKLTKAQELGIKIITEQDLMNMIK